MGRRDAEDIACRQADHMDRSIAGGGSATLLGVDGPRPALANEIKSTSILTVAYTNRKSIAWQGWWGRLVASPPGGAAGNAGMGKASTALQKEHP